MDIVEKLYRVSAIANQFFGGIKALPAVYNMLPQEIKDAINSKEPDVCIQAAIEIAKLREQLKTLKVVL